MIVIQGIPGCGKTTLTKEIGARESIPVCLENTEENPYLDLYYKDPKEYAFRMQMLLLGNNFRNMSRASELPQCVADTSIFTNNIFVELQYEQGFMSNIEHAIYKSMSDLMIGYTKTPDLMVYLECSPSTSVQRILKRNRQCELNASIDYWTSLQRLNQSFYENYSLGKKILINVDDTDIVDDESDLDYIIDTIMGELE